MASPANTVRLGGWVVLVVATLCAGCASDDEAQALPPAAISALDGFYDVRAISAQHVIVVGYAGKVVLTTDGGATWSQRPSGTGRALFAVDFVDTADGWIAGEQGLMLHTVDGGATWRRQRTATEASLFALDFVDRRHGWAVGDHATLLVTADGGAHWEVRALAADQNLTPAEALASTGPALYGVRFVNPSTGWVVGEFGKIAHSSDGGATWDSQEASLLGRDVVDVLDLPTFSGVDFIDERRGVATGLGGQVARTTDGGRTWAFDAMPPAGPPPAGLFAPVVLADGSAWAVGAVDEIVRLAGHVGQWERRSLGTTALTWLRGMHWLDAQRGWVVGGEGVIVRTTDGGTTWRRASS
jgi:photosystem II stability/assembly factor-like uncharacterized protein